MQNMATTTLIDDGSSTHIVKINTVTCHK